MVARLETAHRLEKPLGIARRAQQIERLLDRRPFAFGDQHRAFAALTRDRQRCPVRDYDEALAFYIGKLGFTLVEDTHIPEQGERPSDSAGIASKRWVTIRPPGAPANATTILLARAATPDQARAIGDQAGGRVFLFLATDDFDRDYAAYTQAGVEWVRPPAVQPYGTVAVFQDLYGNRWDLVQFAERDRSALP